MYDFSSTPTTHHPYLVGRWVGGAHLTTSCPNFTLRGLKLTPGAQNRLLEHKIDFQRSKINCRKQQIDSHGLKIESQMPEIKLTP